MTSAPVAVSMPRSTVEAIEGGEVAAYCRRSGLLLWQLQTGGWGSSSQLEDDGGHGHVCGPRGQVLEFYLKVLLLLKINSLLLLHLKIFFLTYPISNSFLFCTCTYL